MAAAHGSLIFDEDVYGYSFNARLFYRISPNSPIKIVQRTSHPGDPDRFPEPGYLKFILIL